ncbi:uncharacterized protein [Clytia hemisphaerica]|uniref:Biogenesis of lysosome-related organelles complex 1 subunit 3 n=1 Tax=Clytia hemisphaerica TaxID=252671 RepID=A0A7M5X7R8_9CNID|eukprot:TCONS_00020066-protein
MDAKATNILEGEASESDDEEISHNTFVNKPIPKTFNEFSKPSNEGPSSGVVVSGEASESDDEDDSTVNMMLTRNFPTLVSQQGLKEFEIQDEEGSVTIQEQKQTFESPFHRGIWERNFALRLGIVRHNVEEYQSIFSKLKNVIPHANRAQQHSQETLKAYRTMGENSKQINDQLEMLLRQTDIPRLKTSFS